MTSSHPGPAKGQDDYDTPQSSNLSEIQKPEDHVTLPESSGPLDEATGDYYHGKRLAIVVVSLMLSTFLVSLDNVSICIPIKTPTATNQANTSSLPTDYPCHSDSQNH